MASDDNVSAPSDEISINDNIKGSALVFGASGEQGHATIRGLLDAGYEPVYGATRDVSTTEAAKVSGMGGFLIKVDLADKTSVKSALADTGATSIFLVTTTDFTHTGGGDNGGNESSTTTTTTYAEAEEKEYTTIKSFFDTLKSVYEQDKISRHVVFSSLDDVRHICDEIDLPGDTNSNNGGSVSSIKPLEDGSICAHYTGKARGGEYGLKLFEKNDDVALTVLTLPLLYSNFMGFAIPLPNDAKTQWTIEAAFGDAAIDMFSANDLSHLVPVVLDDREMYSGYNIRVASEKMTLYDVASIFSDLFGKDIIYNPLTVEEMSLLPFPAAPCMAQMCQFLSDPRSAHDIEVTDAILFPNHPQRFKDWLLTHSDNPLFDRVGLTADPSPILSVTVFGATGRQGTSVVKGLLADKRKRYTIRATSRDITQPKALDLKDLDPERITLVQCDFDDVPSCAAAVDGVDGAFLVTDFYGGAGMDPAVEERHARNVIDACEASHTVRHLVFSTLESVEEMNKKLDLGLPHMEDEEGRPLSVLPEFDAKARAAAYARTKKLSCTYVLMPVYSERFFELLTPELEDDEVTGESKMVMDVPKKVEKKEIATDGSTTSSKADEMPDPEIMCMSVEELGPAVANIFDSYQVYAGHEIGLVTDFVTVSEVAEMITEIFFEDTDENGKVSKGKVEKKDVTVDSWVEKRGTTARDFGQMFRYFSKTDAVKRRRSVAKTLQLCPEAKPMREWLEANKENASFRQRLGLR